MNLFDRTLSTTLDCLQWLIENASPPWFVRHALLLWKAELESGVPR
jgi:hypothetical protein